MEEWEVVSGWPYMVSNSGKVFGLKRGRILKTQTSRYGYETVTFRKPPIGTKKVFKVHRLVALAFLAPVSGIVEVNHKDGNKRNNHFENLEFVTRSENLLHAVRIGLRKYAKGKESCIFKYYHSKRLSPTLEV